MLTPRGEQGLSCSKRGNKKGPHNEDHNHGTMDPDFVPASGKRVITQHFLQRLLNKTHAIHLGTEFFQTSFQPPPPPPGTGAFGSV